MNIKCLVIDDEPLAVKLLEDYISKTYFLELGFSTTNPLEGLQKIQEDYFDLIFLDIQMPELNGMDFLKLLNKKTQVILTTAYSDFALESYEYSVTDYLLKPISYERFYKSALKIKEKKENTLSVSIAENQSKKKDYFFVKSDGRQIKIFYSEILFIEGLRDYVNIKTDNSEYIILENLKDLELFLPPEFLRIHKSYIANLEKISQIEGNRVFINDIPLQIGETYREKFLNWLNAK